MGAVLEAHGLAVRRGRTIVLREVAVELRAGTLTALGGANGSGKTSLLRVLAGIASPARGSVWRAGGCGFVPEKVALAGATRCGEWLAALRALRGLPPLRWGDAAAASGLDPAVLARPSAALSKGMLQRIALLEALHAGMPLLLLDEPFAGLDAAGRDWLAAALVARAAEGAAVLVTDHSGTAAGRLPLVRRLELAAGGCHIAAAAPASAHVAPVFAHAAPASAHVAPVTAHAAPSLILRASHPDGRRLERAVAADASDMLLAELLAHGWHVEELRP